jgi:sec-independent protein translocase protein TatC
MSEKKEMSFWEHLEELRWVLFRVAGVLLVFMIISFFLMPFLFDSFVLAPTSSDFFLYRMLCKISGNSAFLPNFCNDNFQVDIININVATQFLTHISTSFWLAFLLTFPFFIYQIWKFITPALYQNEKKSVGWAFTFGTAMFFIGCAVGYMFIFPVAFRFLSEYQISENIVNHISLDSYMSTFLMLIFIMGIAFELPLLSWLLSKLGLVKKSLFKKYRRHAVVGLLILSALITPAPDPFTLMIVFIPLYMLYELSILVVKE